MKTAHFPHAVVFDWDNTLVDSWPAIMDAINLTRANFGLSIWSLEEIKFNCTRAARESFPEWFGDRWKEAYDFYYEGFNVVRQRRSIQTLLGAENLILWLKSQEIPTFVVSNKRGDFLNIEVEKLGWQEHFIAVVGAQDQRENKPARAHVDFALAKGGITANETVWFVGDSDADMKCAQNSGCYPVLIGQSDLAQKLDVPMVYPHPRAFHQYLETLRFDLATSEKLTEEG